MELARAEVIRSGSPVMLDAEIRTWRGEKRWMRLSINAVREGGRPVSPRNRRPNSRRRESS